MRASLVWGSAVFLGFLGLCWPASAQDPKAFYAGKTVELYIGYSAGGGYDAYARLVARHLGKHVPGNPTVVPVNMPGAGSLKLANWLSSVAPRDGTVLGAVARGVAFAPLLDVRGTDYDAAKFNWIGSANDEVSVCVAWHTSGTKRFEDLKKKELVVGGTGATADTDQFPKILRGILGARLRVISGYPGGNDINLAMERGEVHGRCGWSWSSVVSTRPDWLKEGKIHVLIQLAMSKHEDLPDVPLVTDLATTPEDRKMLRLVFARQVMGRPFVAPPGVPAERVTALRDAFLATLRDPDLLAEARKAQLEITPVSGQAVQALVEEAYDTPKALAKRTADLLTAAE
jgi:tripartite-type tricarboxylate transporter receptor subunit TctC